MGVAVGQGHAPLLVVPRRPRAPRLPRVWGRRSFAPDGAGVGPPTSGRDLASVTPESTAMAKELMSRGFRFVGPNTVYTNELFRLNIEAQKLLDDLGLNFFSDV
jgi:hypothetical protein